MAGPGPLLSVHPTDRLVGQAPVMGALRAQIRHLVLCAVNTWRV